MLLVRGCYEICKDGGGRGELEGACIPKKHSCWEVMGGGDGGLYRFIIYSIIRLNTSALVGDPDPYPQVFQIQNAIPGSVRVSATG